jgi:phosphoribosyl 1,2-cyclic phosphodiesterase
VIIRNLGSGSRGNATVVAHGGRALLIDAGIARRRIVAGLDGMTLESVLVSHVHGDHLRPAAAKLAAPYRMDAANARAAARRDLPPMPVEVFDARPFDVGPFRVTPLPLPHPGAAAWHNYGFFIECGERRLVFATDLGEVPGVLRERLADADVVFLESNHDVGMEEASSRPRQTIDWVLSPHGHLSNEQAAEALAGARRAHTVVLGHLSEECNRPALALRANRRAVPASVRLLVAEQDDATEVVEV